MSATLQKKLKAANAAFAKARQAYQEKGGNKSGEFFNELGRFETQVTDGDVNESQKGRPQCYLEFTITEGEFTGETFRKYWSLEDNADRLSWLIADFARFGVDLQDIESIGDEIRNIVKEKPSVKIKRAESKDGQYVNTYIQKVEGVTPAETPTGDAGDQEGAGEAAASEYTPEVGARVTHSEHGAGVVKSIDEDDKDAVVKFDSGKKETVAWADLAAEGAPAASEPASPEGGDDETIAVGMAIVVDQGKGKSEKGKVTKIDEENAQVTVKLDTGKTVTVGVDKLSLPPKTEKKPMRVGKK